MCSVKTPTPGHKTELCECLYYDWNLLDEVALQLRAAGKAGGVRIPNGRSSKCRQKRARAVEEILRAMKQWPEPLERLVEGLEASRLVDSQVKAHLRRRGIRGARAEEICRSVKSEIALLCLRNSFRSCWGGRRPSPVEGATWYGFVRSHMRTLVKRAIRAHLPRERCVEDIEEVGAASVCKPWLSSYEETALSAIDQGMD